jgi:hypothetical protein
MLGESLSICRSGKSQQEGKEKKKKLAQTWVEIFIYLAI